MSKQLPYKVELFQDKKKIRVQITDADGGYLRDNNISARDSRQHSILATVMRVSISTVIDMIHKVEAGSKIEHIIGEETITVEANIRGIRQPKDQGIRFIEESTETLLTKVISYADFATAEPVIYFESKHIAVVDVDYHGDYKPDNDELERIALLIRPTPRYRHRSHGGGYKIYYACQKGLEANEVAALAAYEWIKQDPRATVEIKYDTRHPLYSRIAADKTLEYCGSVLEGETTLKGVGWSGPLTESIETEDIDEWLAGSGFTKDTNAYGHHLCPIDPTRPSSHPTPVSRLNDGIYCHSCTTHGKSFKGIKTAGFVPYTALLRRQHSDIANCVRYLTHWEHAKHVVTYRSRLRESIAKLVYSAALKLKHGVDDLRIPLVFSAPSIARVAGTWVFTDDKRNTVLQSNKLEVFKQLPAGFSVYDGPTGERKIKYNTLAIDMLSHVGRDLSSYGYTELTPVKGFSLTAIYGSNSTINIPLLDRFNHLPDAVKPTYIRRNSRMSRCAYWELLNSVLPGINQKYVTSLIVMKGLREADRYDPIFMVKGVSSAAKSRTVSAVAGILGDKSTDVIWTENIERLRQGISSGVERGSFVVVDEVFKNSEAVRYTPQQALNPILTLSPNSTSHKLHVGPVPMQGLPVLIFTDISIPQEVCDDIQLSRRLLHISLTDKVDWLESVQRNGIKDVNEVRLISSRHALAANSLLSDIADDYFRDELTITDILSLLGISTLLSSPDYRDRSDDLRKLYTAIVAAPVDGSTHAPTGSGWRKIAADDVSSSLRCAWDAVADSGNANSRRWLSSRRCMEFPWGNVSGCEAGAVLDLVTTSIASVPTLFLRLRTGSFSAPTWVAGAETGTGAGK